MNHFKKWRIYAPLGLALIGLGLSFLGHSIQIKTQAAEFWTWFIWGTVSLVITNAGIAVFGDAVKHRVLYELSTKAQNTNPA